MSVRTVFTGAETPVLRKKAETVLSFDKKLKKLVEDLLETVKTEEGAGLAAPQVGVSERVLIAKIGERFLPFVNPEIMWRSDDMIQSEEGCLSLPNIWLLVSRAREIVVRYHDEKGASKERKFSDFDARVLQHEIDHLDGVLITDYAGTREIAASALHQPAL